MKNEEALIDDFKLAVCPPVEGIFLREEEMIPERPRPLSLSFTQWTQPLWEAESPQSGERGEPSGEWGDLSLKERRQIASDLAHTWLPVSIIAAKNMAACLDFAGEREEAVAGWLERQSFFPTQKSKRKKTSHLLKDAVDSFGAELIDENIWSFMQAQGYASLWQAVCRQKGYILEERSLLQPRFDAGGSQQLLTELENFLPKLTALEPILRSSSLVPPDALILFERALAVQLARGEQKAQIYYQPDIIVAYPGANNCWQVGIWDLKLGRWQETPLWHYTLSFYHKVASALVRSLNRDKKTLPTLLSSKPLNLRLLNETDPGAYGLLLFLEGNPVATRPLGLISGLQTADADDQEFWRLSQRLFNTHQESG